MDFGRNSLVPIKLIGANSYKFSCVGLYLTGTIIAGFIQGVSE